MTERKFKDLKPGEEFTRGNVTYVALGMEQGGVLAVRKEPLHDMPFDKDNKNDWRTSSLRKYLNGEYLGNIDTSDMIEYESDLTSDDGMTDYGKSKDLIFLLSADLYRKYRYQLPKWKTWVWLITPDSCLEEYAYIERSVFTDGSLNDYVASRGLGAAPACLFNPESPLIRADRREQLKPCPFCGGAAMTVIDHETESEFGVKCFNCGGAIYAEKETLQDAVDAWNRRV
jgi:Lar family restriction alleviation protein